MAWHDMVRYCMPWHGMALYEGTRCGGTRHVVALHAMAQPDICIHNVLRHACHGVLDAAGRACTPAVMPNVRLYACCKHGSSKQLASHTAAHPHTSSTSPLQRRGGALAK
eukprot:138014-Chlamydomonas_euryale.AAC.10